MPENAIPFDQPAELGYVCPICKNEAYHKDIDCFGEKGICFFDERLHWSEYDGFLWCAKCNLDIPSCFCVPGMDHKNRKRGMPWYQHYGIKDAIKIYLLSVGYIANHKNREGNVE